MVLGAEHYTEMDLTLAIILLYSVAAVLLLILSSAVIFTIYIINIRWKYRHIPSPKLDKYVM